MVIGPNGDSPAHIFRSFDSSTSGEIRDAAKDPFRVAQKLIILRREGELVQQLGQWVLGAEE